MTSRQGHIIAILGSAFVGSLFLIVSLNSLRWIGTTFPGFFVMANRVIPSIALPSWQEGYPTRFFQSQVLAVNGRPVSSSAEVYDVVRGEPAGTPIEYTLRAPTGQLSSVVVASRSFSARDYALIFGAFLLNGLVFAITGLVVLYLRPGRPASLGLLSGCLATGIFAITAADLYGPHWFFRLHILSESFMSAGFIHLVLVFPTDRIRRHRWPVLLSIYLPYAILALVYEFTLQTPSAYTVVHLSATASYGVGLCVVLGYVVRDLLGTSSAVVRRRLAVVALGTVGGVVVPGILIAVSSVLGGSVPINAGALSGFIFPLSLAYAIVKQDIFELDLALRRGVTLLVALVGIAAAYVAVLWVVGTLVPTGTSAGTLALVDLGLLLLIAPLQAHVRTTVDKVFFRKKYDAELALSEFSFRLASARTVSDVVGCTLQIMRDTLRPVDCAVYLHKGQGCYSVTANTGSCRTNPDFSPDLVKRLALGEILSRYEWDDGSGQPVPPIWNTLGADLIVPSRSAGVPVAIFVLGAKASGHTYAVHDVTFLQTVANQVALGLTNAFAIGQLEELNASLERQVQDRTAALATSNAELNLSLEKLRTAYQLLERNQASLVRADRLATLGRLTAGIAHEINTPLGALLNSVKILSDLGQEYADSIDDPSVLPKDHHEIAAEILGTAGSAAEWARKAAIFIKKVKMHGRDARSDVREPFTVRGLVEETTALLAYRLRTSLCQVDYSEEPKGVGITGDPSLLGQVLVNLIGNALDAYEERDGGGRIDIRAHRTCGKVVITVQDWAGGINAELLPRIFEELFTTKEPGRGTGLGLWIARNLIEESFGGTLTVDSTEGIGSSFAVTLPLSYTPTVHAESAVHQLSVAN
jgi:signal transduction histidine kinase